MNFWPSPPKLQHKSVVTVQHKNISYLSWLESFIWNLINKIILISFPIFSFISKLLSDKWDSWCRFKKNQTFSSAMNNFSSWVISLHILYVSEDKVLSSYHYIKIMGFVLATFGPSLVTPMSLRIHSPALPLATMGGQCCIVKFCPWKKLSICICTPTGARQDLWKKAIWGACFPPRGWPSYSGANYQTRRPCWNNAFVALWR